MKKFIRIRFIVVAFVSIFLISCKSISKQSSSEDLDSKTLVLTTFTVIADIARNVAGDRLIVHSITKPGVEIHGYTPTPNDLTRASKADLIIENGFGLELWSNKFTNSGYVL